jgi:hypothetical protein
MAKQIGNDLDFNNAAKILNLPAATQSGQPVTYDQLNSAIEGLAWKDSARVSTQANLNISSPGATISGVAMTANDRVLVRANTSQGENGLYIWNGAAVPMTRTIDANSASELEGAIVTIEEGVDAGSSWRQTQVNFVLGTNNVVWVSFGTAAPTASTTVSGTVVIATQAEVDAGTDPSKVVTPAILAGAANRKLKALATIGDGSATQIDVTHNLNTLDCLVEVYRNATPWDSILCDVERPNANTIRLRFAVAPTANQFKVVILA